MTWEVNTTADVAAGTWDTTDSIVSLREAITRAEAGDTIHFAESLAGGTIILSGTQLTIDKSLIIDASALDGGITIDANKKSRVFYITAGTANAPVQLNGLNITGGMTSNTNGGGIYNTGELTVTNSTISGNSANGYYSYGGGIYNYQGELTVMNSTISGNSASSGGGISNGGELTVTNTTISGNSASRNGGGIYNDGELTVTNSTISGNSASSDGGGIYHYYYNSGTLTVTNSIIAQNYASVSCNNIYNDIDGTISETSGHNIIGYNPLFVVAPVFDTDGVLTNGETLDLRLTAGSRAIDAGSSDVTLAEFDLDGNPRVVGNGVDIGAYEFQGTPASEPTIFSTVVDTLEDSFVANDGQWSLREALYWATGSGTITFDESLAGGTIYLNSCLNVYGMSIDAGSLGITLDAQQKDRVMNTSGDVTLNGLTITGGKASSGGGIYNSGTLTVTNSTISGNSADYGGGGIFNSFGTITVTNSTISENSADDSISYGGGIYNYGELTVTNSTISGNSASSYGGGIYNDEGTITVTNSTISGNSASYYGGGIYNYYYHSGTLTVTNSIIAQNYTIDSNNDLYGTISETSGHNIIGYNPLFVVAPVFDTDGVLTNGETLDLRLTAGSRAIDAGSSDVTIPEFDLDGHPRVVGNGVDIGAYEFQGTPASEPTTFSTVVDTLEDSFDANDGKWSLREALYWVTGSGTITFDESLAGGTIYLNRRLDVHGMSIDGGSLGITLDAQQKDRVMNTSGDVTLNGLTITGGKTSSYGGGIYNSGTLTVTNSTISGNSARSGGGIYNSGTLTVTNSTISGNSASSSTSYGASGGGIYNGYRGELTVTNTTISGNSASYYGGGIYNYYDGELTVTNSTISGNSASSGGGGIYNNGTLNIFNSLVVCNIAESGEDIYNNGTITAYNSLSSYTEWGGENNLVYDPKKALFLSIEDGDYRLAAGSQAIDKGNNQYAYNAGLDETSLDRDGQSRFRGENIDIGAYEYQPSNQIDDVAVTGYTGTYDGAKHGVTLTGLLAGDTVVYSTDEVDWKSDALTWSSVGGYTVYVKVSRTGFEDWTGSAEVLISQKQLTVTGTIVADKVYDGTTTATVTLGTVSGIVSGDTVNVTPSSAFPSAEVGTYSLNVSYTLSGAAAANYIAPVNSTASASIIVEPTPPVPVKLDTPNILTLTADGTTATIQFSTVANGSLYIVHYADNESFTGYKYVTSTNGSASVSNLTEGTTYYFRVQARDTTATYINSDYSTVSWVTIPVTPTPPPIDDVTVAGYTGIYDGVNHGVTLTGLLADDTVVYSTDEADWKSDVLTWSSVGSYMVYVKISRTGFEDWTGSAEVLISQKQLTVTGTTVADKVYDGTTTATVTLGTVSGIVSGDTVNVIPSTAFPSAEVGTYSLTVSYTLSGAAAANYIAPVNSTASASINQEELAVAWEVNTTADVAAGTWDTTDNIVSLREAITRAEEGDTIHFAESLAGGTITLSGTQLTIDKSLMIDASALDGGITIDANKQSRVFYITVGTDDAPVQLIGLNITGGMTSDDGGEGNGGGIYNSGTLTVTNSTISGNSADDFGCGIYNSGTLTVTNSTISGNSAKSTYYVSSGGGICNWGGELTITNSTISGNSAGGDGGGILNYDGRLTVTNSTISDNSAGNSLNYESGGGGICNIFGTLVVLNSMISGNLVSGPYRDGGGIYNYDGELTVTNSTISGNDLDGIYCDGESTITNSTITGNDGVGIENSGELTVTNTTISGNSGGGIFNFATLNIFNSLVVCNAAENGGDIVIFNEGTITAYNSLSSYTEWSGENNLVYDPKKPLFLSIEDGDYRLAPNSQAIDKGNNQYAYNAGLGETSLDRDGQSRFRGEKIDIGAYEFQPSNQIDDVAVTGYAGIYDGAKHGVTFTGLLAGDTVVYSTDEVDWKSDALTWSSVGNYTVYVKVSRGFEDWTGSAEVLISQKQLTVTGTTVADKIYDGTTTATVTLGTVSGIVGDDTVNVTPSSAFPSAEVGTYSLNVSYTLSGAAAAIYIAPVDSTVSASIIAEPPLPIVDKISVRVILSESAPVDVAMTELADSLTETYSGRTVYAQVWIKNNDGSPNGIVGGYMDIAYSDALLTGASVTPGANFASLAEWYTIDSGKIATFGGVVSAGKVTFGVDAWVLFGYTTFFVTSAGMSTDQTAVISTGTPSYEGITEEAYNLSRSNEGNIASDDIDFGSVTLTVHPTEPLSAPENIVTASAGANRVTVSWDAVENAVGYTVSWSTDQETWTEMAATGTSTVVTGLTYGALTYYRVKAVGNGMSYTDSEYSVAVSRIVCPMDIDGDGRIGPSDMNAISSVWFTRSTSSRWDPRCDIDGDGTIGPSDMSYLSGNWLKKSSAVTIFPAARADMTPSRNDAVDAVFDEIFTSPWDDDEEDFA